MSETYTDKMAMSIHDAWRRSVVKRGRRAAGAPPSVKAACALNAGIPRMPLRETPYPHRQTRNHWPSTAAAVARTVSKSELQGREQAKDAMKKEWLQLAEKGCFKLKEVQEWSTVKAKANHEGFKVRVGRVFGTRVEEGSELPPKDEGRYCRGDMCSKATR